MKLKIILLVVVAVVALASLLGFVYFQENKAIKNIQSFAECAQNGFPVQESYPRQCRTPDGRSFVEEITQPIQPLVNDLITVSVPQAHATVTSPLSVAGQARGFWFFEASFPIELRGSAGEIVANGTAHATGDWMTEDFVPFTATLNFVNPTIQNGELILRKDNPSGLAEHDDQLVVPVIIGVSK